MNVKVRWSTISDAWHFSIDYTYDSTYYTLSLWDISGLETYDG